MNRKTTTSLELWQVTGNWLTQMGNRPDFNFCREEITTHPDYPAITAVTDFLDSGGMEYNTVQADASFINEFKYPLLAHIRQPAQEFMHIIKESSEWDKQKEITQHWSGIVIYPGMNCRWQNVQNDTSRNETFKNKAIVIIMMAAGILLLLAASARYFNISAILFNFLSLTGLVISTALLGAEWGYQSNIVKQVCGTVSAGGCEKVLKSRYANGVLGITPAGAAVAYFGAQFVLCLLSIFLPLLSPGMFLLTCLGVPVAVWSIYTQWIKLKQWCALCIGICITLTMQAILLLFFSKGTVLNNDTILSTAIFLGLAAFFHLAIAPFKKLIQANRSNKQKLAELKKWKTDTDLFITQWQQGVQVDTAIWKNDIVLGKSEATLLITVACNPYCNPCAKAHEKLDALLNRFPGKVKIQMRLMCKSNNENDKRTIAVKAILEKAQEITDNKELQQMLTDWFGWTDFEKWNAKWNAKGNVDVKESLVAHANWIINNAVQFTPTFFINGHKLPGRYSLDDMEALIPRLSDILNEQLVK
ncbi:vitamin K epoxide reductase family protein [Ferruginibacter sp.]